MKKLTRIKIVSPRKLKISVGWPVIGIKTVEACVKSRVRSEIPDGKHIPENMTKEFDFGLMVAFFYAGLDWISFLLRQKNQISKDIQFDSHYWSKIASVEIYRFDSIRCHFLI